MKKIRKEDKAGIYITVIVHLTVIIVLLVAKISGEISRENTFVLDFSKQEMMEEKAREKEKEQSVKAEAAKRLEQLLSKPSTPSGGSTRNVAVNRSNSSLKDDRNTDADQLYKDAAKLAKELKNVHSDVNEDARNETVDLSEAMNEKEGKTNSYSGPSVLSWTLEGRNASHLPIPAYRCMGEGEVTVMIAVNNAGTVVDAKVVDDASSNDGCLRSFAVRAARNSRFSASTSAPAKQMGSITYCFIAQ